MAEKKHSHYFKDVSHLQSVDVYRILELFEVTCPVAQHIVKKALAAGKRGAKDQARDMQDIIDSAQRWQAMRQEDEAKEAPVHYSFEDLVHVTLAGANRLDAAYDHARGAA